VEVIPLIIPSGCSLRSLIANLLAWRRDHPEAYRRALEETDARIAEVVNGWELSPPLVTTRIHPATDASVAVVMVQVYSAPLVSPEAIAVFPVVCVAQNVDPAELNSLSR
jgi:hypothetical protein